MLATETKLKEPSQDTEDYVTLFTDEDGFQLLFILKDEAYCFKKPETMEYKLLVPKHAITEEKRLSSLVVYDNDIQVIEKLTTEEGLS